MDNLKNSDCTVRWCDCCKDPTRQVIELFDPDDPESAKVWQCCDCRENVDFVDKFNLDIQQKFFNDGKMK